MADISSITLPNGDIYNIKDANAVKDANYVHTDNNFTDALKTKLNGIQTGATVDDKTWNGVSLSKSKLNVSSALIPIVINTSDTTAYYATASTSPIANYIAMYGSGNILKSATPASGDSSTNVATTAFVQTENSIQTIDGGTF